MKKENKLPESNLILLSTDSLAWYGLDLIFSIASKAWFDGLDLAMRKNYDARHPDYVQELSKNHNLPIKVIQTSNKTNAKELNQAVELAQTLEVSHIAINPPSYFDMKTYTFLTNNLHTYQQQYPEITFTIITPDTKSMKYLPLPQYHFGNIPSIISKYKCHIGIDIATLTNDIIEEFLLVKIPSLVKDISICYVGDKTKSQKYLVPGEGDQDILPIFKALHTNIYKGFFDVKLSINAQTLVNRDKVITLLEKSINYIHNHYQSL
jgi:sugar phosphate isomerase/epimerase